MNKRRLESVMKLHGDTGTTLASYLGMARTTFSAKINETNGAEFTQKEIAAIRLKYCLKPEDIVDIFFNQKLSKKDILEVIEVESCVSIIISAIIGTFIGHGIYDIYKTHKTHKGNEK